MLKLNQIRLLKKMGTIFLVMLLSFLLVFNTCIDVHANAIAVGTAIFLLVTAILAACGITFATNEAAQAGASAFYDNCAPDVRAVIDDLAFLIEKEFLPLYLLGEFIGVNFDPEFWGKLLESVVLTFGTYEGIDAVLNLTASYDTLSISNPQIRINATCTTSNSVVTNLYNTQVSWYGVDSVAFADAPAFAREFYNTCTWNSGWPGGLSVVNVGGIFSFVTVWRGTNYGNGIVSSAVDFALGQSSSGRINTIYVGTGYAPSMPALYLSAGTYSACFYQGQLVKAVATRSTSGQSYTHWGTSSYSNIISDGYWAGTSVAIPNAGSICPDGFIGNLDINDVLVGLGFGNDVITPDVGNPSIDAPAYPGNDTWHDGSINDDVAVGNPTIGIAVPTSADDVISLNPDIARDYDSATTKLGDIVGSDSTTGDTTGDSSGDSSTSNPPKNGNTGSLPALSLPEILFKTKFPFCLPWDLYTLFAMLDAEPVAPKFEIPFEIERLGIKESITIDLSQFEEQVEIVRFFLGASFVLALILISRKMIGAD